MHRSHGKPGSAPQKKQRGRTGYREREIQVRMLGTKPHSTCVLDAKATFVRCYNLSRTEYPKSKGDSQVAEAVGDDGFINVERWLQSVGDLQKCHPGPG